MKSGQLVLLMLLSCHQLCGRVESKNRNRVQKWQQRTWKARFGDSVRNDWKSAFEPVKAHRRSRYGLSPREEDLLTQDGVPNGYSDFHFRRYGDAGKRQHRGNGATGGKRREGRKHLEVYRMKRYAPEHDGYTFDFDSPEEVRFDDDLADMEFLRDEPAVDFVPIQLDPSQRFTILEEDDPIDKMDPVKPDAKGGRKTKEYKFVIRQRNLDSGSSRMGESQLAAIVSVSFLLTVGKWL